MVQRKKIHNLFFCSCFFFTISHYSYSENKKKITFDEGFVVGDNNYDMSRFKYENGIPEGKYKFDLIINKDNIGKEEIKIISSEDGDNLCLTKDNIATFERFLKIDTIKLSEDTDCKPIDDVIPGVTFHINISTMSISIFTPQYNIRDNDIIFDSGINTGFINYNLNYYNSEYTTNDDSKSKIYNLYLTTRSGINIGEWHFINNSIYSKSKNNTGKIDVINNYLERPIPGIRSNLLIGDSFTSGSTLNSVNFKGVKLESDNRMLPQNKRIYSPVINAVAKSNAIVTVKQQGKLIYQTTVTPGPFRIDNLTTLNNGADLDVTVTESDGSEQHLLVPYISANQLLQDGISDYSVSAGRLDTQSSGNKPSLFQADYSIGLSNLLTGKIAVQLSEDYKAPAIGAGFNTSFGSLGFDIISSSANLKNTNETKNGYSVKLNYSNSIPISNTSLSLSSYFYDKNYYTLYDATSSNHNLLREKSRYDVVINQPVSNLGNLYLTSMFINHWDDEYTSKSYQFGYSFVINKISFGINAGKIKNTDLDSENSIGINISVPLESSSGSYSNLNFSINHSNDNTDYNAGYSGVIGEDRETNYNIGMTYNNTNNKSINGSLSKKYSPAEITFSGSRSNDYSQYASGLMGAVYIHSDGVTLGQFSNSTVALIEAKNLDGTKVENSPGVKIDSSGYAIVPNITAYSTNTITLNPTGLSDTTELLSNDIKIKPYDGSVAKVKFHTRSGYKAFIQTYLENNQLLPMGALVTNEEKVIIGMVGINGQIYVSGLSDSGKLKVSWDNSPDGSCFISYNIKDNKSSGMQHLSAPCIFDKGDF